MTHHLDQYIPLPAQDESRLEISVDPSLGLVSLAGELDRDHAPQLANMLPVLARTAHQVWVVDVAGVTYCDAGGLHALADAAAVAGDHGRRLQITRSSRRLQRLITLVELDHLLVPQTGAPEQQAFPGPDAGPRPGRAPHRIGQGAAGAPR